MSIILFYSNTGLSIIRSVLGLMSTRDPCSINQNARFMCLNTVRVYASIHTEQEVEWTEVFKVAEYRCHVVHGGKHTQPSVCVCVCVCVCVWP